MLRENISRTVDVEKVAEASRHLLGVAHACDYKYMCSDPGQSLLKKAVAEHRLDGVVVAACSPRMHEKTFRKATEQAGLNPFLCEMANIREHCSWVHEDRGEATAKAIDIVHMLVERVKRNRKLQPISVPVTKRSLVIGGGIAGIQAALDIADAGHQVVLVEREPSIGGHMAQLSETFPTLDCSQCIMIG
jgi:heterodisulfide reductase subunit A